MISRNTLRPRKNRRRRYEDKVKYAPEVQESNGRTSEMGFRTEEESPQLEPALQPRTDADEDIPSCRDKKDNYGSQKQPGSDTYFPSGEHSGFFDRPVTESVTARAGCDTDFPSGKHSEFFDRPVTESVPARAGSDTDFPNGNDSEFFRPTGHGVGDGTGRKWYRLSQRGTFRIFQSTGHGVGDGTGRK